MSPKNSVLTIGLTALVLLGDSATRAAYPGEPPAASGPPSAPVASPTHTVLLLSNGRILQGAITEEGADYVVRQSGGPIRVRKADAERAFGSMADLYRHKRAETNERDPDERLKLARWCMSQDMPAEAKEELRAVVALSPSSANAKAMLSKMEAAESRAAARPKDDALVQASAEVVEPADRQAPAEMDAAAVRRARREMGLSGIPVIFDLPPTVAVKRADEFARAVHPVLQMTCAKCHNEQHAGQFQLVEVKRRKEMSVNVLRANLDATLRFIDPENPAKSELLSSALVPHGNGANKRPIFGGSNDPRFQVIATWVNKLRPTPAPGKGTEGVVQTRFGPKDTPGGSPFGVDRGSNPGGSSQASTPVLPVPAGGRFDVGPAAVLTPKRYVPGRGLVTEEAPPPADEFPIPPMLGGPKPRFNTAAPAGTPTADGKGPGLPAKPGDPTATAEAAKPKPPAKPVKIDPALLERALMNRNGAR